MREQPLLPARQKDDLELQPLGRMQGHDRNPLALLRAFDVHDQRHVLEEGAEVGKFAHRAHEFLEVVEPAGRVGRPLGLPHVDIAALLENLLRQLVVRDLARPLAPQFDPGDEVAAESRAAGP